MTRATAVFLSVFFLCVAAFFFAMCDGAEAQELNVRVIESGENRHYVATTDDMSDWIFHIWIFINDPFSGSGDH